MVDCVTAVEGLSQREKNSILTVLQRDEELRHGQEQKISNLRREINQIRMCGVLRAGDDQTKMCLRCRAEFGMLFNRGTLCPSCRFKVCKNCQEVMFNGSWLCTLCYKQRQLKWLTGEWTASFEQNPMRKWASGSDLVKASMQLMPGSTSIDIDEPSDNHDNVQQGKKVARNGVGGGRSEENRTRVSVPKEGDQHKLSELFNVLRVKKTEDAPAPSETQVRRVTSRRYSESDSDSSSNSDADIRSTSTAPSMTESELDGRRIDSPQGMESPPRIIEPPRVARVEEIVQPRAVKHLESSEYRLENGNQRPKASPRSPKPAARRKVKSEHYENDNPTPSARPRHRDRRDRPLPENTGHGHPSMTRSVDESSGRVTSDIDRQDNTSVHSVELSLHVAKTRESLDKKYEVEKSRSQASLNRVSGYNESEQFVRPKSKERIVRKSNESLSKELKHGVSNSEMDITEADRNSGADVSSVHSGSRSGSSVKSSGSKDTLISNRSVPSDPGDKDAVSLKSIPDIQEPSDEQDQELMVSVTVPRAGSPYSISMDSLPSSHPSPTNLRHSIGESSNAESSDTDSLSRYGSRPNVLTQQGGLSASSRGSGDPNDVVEEISKVHFKRVSKTIGKMGAIAKITRSPNKNDSGDNGLEVVQIQTQSRGADKEEGGGLQCESVEHVADKSETSKSLNVLRSVSNESYEDSVFAEADSIDDILNNVGSAQLFVEKTMSAAISEADSDAVWNSTPISPFPQEMYKRRSGKYNRFAFISDDDLLDDNNDDEGNHKSYEPKQEEDGNLDEKENTVTEEEELVPLHHDKKKLKAMGSLDMLLSEQGDEVDGFNDHLGEEYQKALEFVETEDVESLEEEIKSKEIEQSHVRGLSQEIVPKVASDTHTSKVELNNSGHKALARISGTKPSPSDRAQVQVSKGMTVEEFDTDNSHTQGKAKLKPQNSLDVLVDQQGDFADKDSQNVELDPDFLAQLERQFTQELDAQKSDISLKSEYAYLGVQHNVKDVIEVSDHDHPDDIDSLAGNAKHYLEMENNNSYPIPVLPHIALLQLNEGSVESSESDMLSVIDEEEEGSETSETVEKMDTDLNALDDVKDNLRTPSRDVLVEDTHDEETVKGRYKKSKAIEKRIQSLVSSGDINCQKVVQSKLVGKKSTEKYKRIHDHWLAVERHEADILDDKSDDEYDSEEENDETEEHDDEISFGKKKLEGMGSLDLLLSEQGNAIDDDEDIRLSAEYLDALNYSKEDGFSSPEEELKPTGSEQSQVISEIEFTPSQSNVTENVVPEMQTSGHKMLTRNKLLHNSGKKGSNRKTVEDLTKEQLVSSPVTVKAKLKPQDSLDVLVAQQRDFHEKDSKNVELNLDIVDQTDGKFTKIIVPESSIQVKSKLKPQNSLDVLLAQQGHFADTDQFNGKFTEKIVPQSSILVKSKLTQKDSLDMLLDQQGHLADRDSKKADKDVINQLEGTLTEKSVPKSSIPAKSKLKQQDSLDVLIAQQGHFADKDTKNTDHDIHAQLEGQFTEKIVPSRILAKSKLKPQDSLDVLVAQQGDFAEKDSNNVALGHDVVDQLDGKTTEKIVPESSIPVKSKLTQKDSLDGLLEQQGGFADKDSKNVELDYAVPSKLEAKTSKESVPEPIIPVKSKLKQQDSLDMLIAQQGHFADKDSLNVELDNETIDQMDGKFTEKAVHVTSSIPVKLQLKPQDSLDVLLDQQGNFADEGSKNDQDNVGQLRGQFYDPETHYQVKSKLAHKDSLDVLLDQQGHFIDKDSKNYHNTIDQHRGKFTEEIDPESSILAKSKLKQQDSLDVLLDQQSHFVDRDSKYVELDHDIVDQVDGNITERIVTESIIQVKSKLKPQDSLDDILGQLEGKFTEEGRSLNDDVSHKKTDKSNGKSILPHTDLFHHQTSASVESNKPSVTNVVEKRKNEQFNTDTATAFQYKKQMLEEHKVVDSLQSVSSTGDAHEDGHTKATSRITKAIEKKVKSFEASCDSKNQRSVHHEQIVTKVPEKYKKIHDHWLAVKKHWTDTLDIEELEKETDKESIEKNRDLEMNITETENVAMTTNSGLNNKLFVHIPDINLTDTAGITSPDIVVDNVERETIIRVSRNTEFEQELFKPEGNTLNLNDTGTNDYSYLGASINDSNSLCHSIRDMSTESDSNNTINDSAERCNSIPDLSLDNIAMEYNTKLSNLEQDSAGRLNSEQMAYLEEEINGNKSKYSNLSDSNRQCDSIPDMCDSLSDLQDNQCHSIPEQCNSVRSIPDISEIELHDVNGPEIKSVKTSNLHASKIQVTLPGYQSTDGTLDKNNAEVNGKKFVTTSYSYLGGNIQDNSNLCNTIRDAVNITDIDNCGIVNKEANSVEQENDKTIQGNQVSTLQPSIHDVVGRCHSIADETTLETSNLQVNLVSTLESSIHDVVGRCYSIADEIALETPSHQDSRATVLDTSNTQFYEVPHDQSNDQVKSHAQFVSHIDLKIEKGGKVTPPATMSDAKFVFDPPQKPPRLIKDTPPSSVPSSPDVFRLHDIEERSDSPRSEKLAGTRDSPQTISECSVSQDDSGHVSGGSRGATPEHKRTDSSYSQSSLPSSLSTVTDEDEDIDRVVANVKKQTLSGSRGLLSIFGDSRESLASYYSDAGDIAYSNVPITGEILFSLNYNYKTSMLEVGIKQCRDIAMADSRRNRSDPYVKTYLLPDRTRGGKRKTKVKKHTTNPTFDETLKYPITKSELENRTLWVTVWHNDRFGRNAFLGEVTINFDYFKFEDPFPKWYPLQERMDAPPQSMMVYKGDLSICIRYVPAEKPGAPSTSTGKQKRESSRGQLQVMVKEARNLTAVRANGFSDPFCKGYLLPERHKSSKQKTPVMKKDCNPVWNHTFVFEDVTLMELRERCLELTVWDYEKLTSNDFLGGVRLNLGTGLSQAKGVDWMDARGEEMSMWQAMLDRPNIWIDGALILRPNMDKRKF